MGYSMWGTILINVGVIGLGLYFLWANANDRFNAMSKEITYWKSQYSKEALLRKAEKE